MGFPDGSVVKKPPARQEMRVGSPGEGNGNPLRYSCLGNSMDRGAWGLQSMESQESQTRFSDGTTAATTTKTKIHLIPNV